MHGITLIPAYMPTHLSVEANHLSLGRVLHLLPCITQAAFHLWSQPEVDLLASSHTSQCQLYYTLANPLLLGALMWNVSTTLGHIRQVVCFLLQL